MHRLIAAAVVPLMLSALFTSAQAVAAEKTSAGIYELRVYTTAKDRLPNLYKRFRDHTVALFKKHGMTNVIYWTPVDKPNTLIYLLKHDSVEARNKSFAAFRDDPAWKKAYAESRKDGPIVTKVESTLLTATDYSPKAFSPAASGWIYELRTYTTEKGRLPALNARFRDHTLALFNKHGIRNVLYTTPLDDKRKENTLIYVIAHKDKAAAASSWKDFGADPAWKKAAADSQKDGRILTRGGVERVYLNTTDYSPVK